MFCSLCDPFPGHNKDKDFKIWRWQNNSSRIPMNISVLCLSSLCQHRVECCISVTTAFKMLRGCLVRDLCRTSKNSSERLIRHVFLFNCCCLMSDSSVYEFPDDIIGAWLRIESRVWAILTSNRWIVFPTHIFIWPKTQGLCSSTAYSYQPIRRWL